MPYFSIIIPSFNRTHIIDRAIQGVLQQTFQDFEILIVDDGSTDNTQAIVKEYSADLKIKYIYQNNQGVCSARNTGAKEANGAYLIFLDSDDTVEKSWLQDFYDSLKKNQYDIAYCNITILKSDGTKEKIDAANPYGNNTGKGADMAGSSGRGNGIRSIATKTQEFPGTSTPCQSDIVPSRIEVSSFAKRSTSGPTASPRFCVIIVIGNSFKTSRR